LRIELLDCFGQNPRNEEKHESNSSQSLHIIQFHHLYNKWDNIKEANQILSRP